MSNTNEQLPNVQENTSQILNDIQSLQTIEQELFNSLEENTGLTTEQQKKVVEKINGISKMRTRYHIARIRNDFEGIYTFKVTPIGSEQYGQSDAIFNAIHNT